MDTNKQKCEEPRKIRMQMDNSLGIHELIRKEPCNFELESPFRTDKPFINDLLSPFRTDKHKDNK